jgi:DNA-binding response OmpR family regulator
MEGLREFERDGYLPVLAITGEPGHRMPALKLGAKDFLRKPVDPEELLLRVRNMIEVRLLYKELLYREPVPTIAGQPAVAADNVVAFAGRN